MYTCSECGKECGYHTGNDGIGAYEFWGYRGNDVRMVLSSDCCDAEVLDEFGEVYTYSDYKYEYECEKADAEYERRKEEELLRSQED